MSNLRPIFYDTETTGTRPDKDRIIEIAAFDPVNNRTFEKFVNPGIAIPAEATAIHHITNEMVADAPSFGVVGKEFIEFCSGDTVLIAHNNDTFDLLFLKHEFITLLPLGYQTELSATGSNLSGGQQQRLAIARALVKKAPILVLDEATSALDTLSELRIKTAIHELRGQVTQILIAHRLTTIEDADRIIYLENGSKIAEGTLEELLQTCSGFKRMWDISHRSANIEN